MFNLQSGLLRQRFPPKLTPAQARRAKLEKAGGAIVDLSHNLKKFGLGEGKHGNSVTGLAVDGLNKVVISCGLDGKLKVSLTGLNMKQNCLIFYTSFGVLRLVC
jgi:U3 small nucleolar RNA-associated protein 21